MGLLTVITHILTIYLLMQTYYLQNKLYTMYCKLKLEGSETITVF